MGKRLKNMPRIDGGPISARDYVGEVKKTTIEQCLAYYVDNLEPDG
jgi:hypothetical protein